MGWGGCRAVKGTSGVLSLELKLRTKLGHRRSQKSIQPVRAEETKDVVAGIQTKHIFCSQLMLCTCLMLCT